MARFLTLVVLGVQVLLPLAFAQLYTDCNPTLTNCPSDPGLSSTFYSIDFTQARSGLDSSWTSLAGNVVQSPQGAAFTVSKEGGSTTISTSWYFFFGRAEVLTRAASGTGIVSCVVLESDDLDEIDWEFTGSAKNEVQTNYFGKGNDTNWDRGANFYIADTQAVTHNYTIDWNPETVRWYIDGRAVRTLRYENAVGGSNYPQTPMRLKLGIWAGGDPANPPGTIEWAGGVTDYTKGPFTMLVESVSITNANPATKYSYGDKSGDWESIIIT